MQTVSEATDPTELLELVAMLRSVGGRYPRRYPLSVTFHLECVADQIECDIAEMMWDPFLQSWGGLDREKVKFLSRDDDARLSEDWNAYLRDLGVTVPGD